ncbi:hypothetical protein BLNAU_1766 [Blattamonas nauphoetae]|uniref:Uncharacterized protein n=1 Tax=Blattamonas nauphoetae TaxID=2049346 RepID=A0ABQ9YHM6_9EUKA|nr:hypothetical protein BLNAU_1766 [Blattamonas nauphoetae]
MHSLSKRGCYHKDVEPVPLKTIQQENADKSISPVTIPFGAEATAICTVNTGQTWIAIAFADPQDSNHSVIAIFETTELTRLSQQCQSPSFDPATETVRCFAAKFPTQAITLEFSIVDPRDPFHSIGILGRSGDLFFLSRNVIEEHIVDLPFSKVVHGNETHTRLLRAPEQTNIIAFTFLHQVGNENQGQSPAYATSRSDGSIILHNSTISTDQFSVPSSVLLEGLSARQQQSLTGDSPATYLLPVSLYSYPAADASSQLSPTLFVCYSQVPFSDQFKSNVPLFNLDPNILQFPKGQKYAITPVIAVDLTDPLVFKNLKVDILPNPSPSQQAILRHRFIFTPISKLGMLIIGSTTSKHLRFIHEIPPSTPTARPQWEHIRVDDVSDTAALLTLDFDDTTPTGLTILFDSTLTVNNSVLPDAPVLKTPNTDFLPVHSKTCSIDTPADTLLFTHKESEAEPLLVYTSAFGQIGGIMIVNFNLPVSRKRWISGSTRSHQNGSLDSLKLEPLVCSHSSNEVTPYPQMSSFPSPAKDLHAFGPKSNQDSENAKKTQTGGFANQQTGGFGQTQQGGFGNQQQGSAFGNQQSNTGGGFANQTQTQQGGTGGGFGTQQNQQGGFANQTQTQQGGTGGGFGAQQNQQGGFANQQTGGFGQTQQGGFGNQQQGSAFGNQQLNTGGGFGNQQQIGGGGFGTQQQSGFANQPSGGFGNQQQGSAFGKPGGTTGGGFGTQQQSGFATQQGGGFGQQNRGFGTNTGSAFGNQQQGSAFGNQGGVGGGFGNQQQSSFVKQIVTSIPSTSASSNSSITKQNVTSIPSASASSISSITQLSSNASFPTPSLGIPTAGDLKKEEKNLFNQNTTQNVFLQKTNQIIQSPVGVTNQSTPTPTILDLDDTPLNYTTVVSPSDMNKLLSRFSQSIQHDFSSLSSNYTSLATVTRRIETQTFAVSALDESYSKFQQDQTFDNDSNIHSFISVANSRLKQIDEILESLSMNHNVFGGGPSHATQEIRTRQELQAQRHRNISIQKKKEKARITSPDIESNESKLSLSISSRDSDNSQSILDTLTQQQDSLRASEYEESRKKERLLQKQRNAMKYKTIPSQTQKEPDRLDRKKQVVHFPTSSKTLVSNSSEKHMTGQSTPELIQKEGINGESGKRTPVLQAKPHPVVVMADTTNEKVKEKTKDKEREKEREKEADKPFKTSASPTLSDSSTGSHLFGETMRFTKSTAPTPTNTFGTLPQPKQTAEPPIKSPLSSISGAGTTQAPSTFGNAKSNVGQTQNSFTQSSGFGLTASEQTTKPKTAIPFANTMTASDAKPTQQKSAFPTATFSKPDITVVPPANAGFGTGSGSFGVSTQPKAGAFPSAFGSFPSATANTSVQSQNDGKKTTHEGNTLFSTSSLTAPAPTQPDQTAKPPESITTAISTPENTPTAENKAGLDTISKTPMQSGKTPTTLFSTTAPLTTPQPTRNTTGFGQVLPKTTGVGMTVPKQSTFGQPLPKQTGFGLSGTGQKSIFDKPATETLQTNSTTTPLASPTQTTGLPEGSPADSPPAIQQSPATSAEAPSSIPKQQSGFGGTGMAGQTQTQPQTGGFGNTQTGFGQPKAKQTAFGSQAATQPKPEAQTPQSAFGQTQPQNTATPTTLTTPQTPAVGGTGGFGSTQTGQQPTQTPSAFGQSLTQQSTPGGFGNQQQMGGTGGGFGTQQNQQGGFANQTQAQQGGTGGGFGQNQTQTQTGGFANQQTGGFGQKQQQGGFGNQQKGSAFGNQQSNTGGGFANQTQTQQGGTGGGFGTQQNQQGGFANQTQTQQGGTGGGFGAQQNQQGGFANQQTGGFGQTQQGGFGNQQQGSAFGNQQLNTGGGFGNQQQIGGGGFGTQQQSGFANQPSGGFGNQQQGSAFGKPGGTTGGGFGTQQQSGFATQQGGGFGQQNRGFGTNTGSAFGNQQQGSAFGNQGGVGGGFGNQQQSGFGNQTGFNRPQGGMAQQMGVGGFGQSTFGGQQGGGGGFGNQQQGGFANQQGGGFGQQQNQGFGGGFGNQQQGGGFGTQQLGNMASNFRI